jgi:cytochrome c peroxidase
MEEIKNQVKLAAICLLIVLLFPAFKEDFQGTAYTNRYHEKISSLLSGQKTLLQFIEGHDINSEKDIEKIKDKINLTRVNLKLADFWLRYLEPTSYKKINGSLPVEWETEVFEKFEKPYKREGAGLTLAWLYLEEQRPKKDTLLKLVKSAIPAIELFKQDSITHHLNSYHHFLLCNRLFLLNLAAIYTSGFECPDTSRIIPELNLMLSEVNEIYSAYNRSFHEQRIPENYLSVYKKAIDFVKNQPNSYVKFDHFTFIRDYVNPLFSLNQNLIVQYNVSSKSYMDYSLNKNATSIFSKTLYRGQNPKGIYTRIYDTKILKEIENTGRLLFHDPILSGNNLRSCSSCHKPSQYFTDTCVATALEFSMQKRLPRNSPSLINAQFNHLIMLDGKHISLQAQTKDVMTNPIEMGSTEQDLLKKILSCKDYEKFFRKIVKHTPGISEPTIDHVSSAITYYYSRFSSFPSKFDNAMNKAEQLSQEEMRGFNLFMSKAQCATCHFAPQFNGVKPPYIGSEFEVLGVPKDKNFTALSEDNGRHAIHPAFETLRAFRTGTLRNSEKTKPYMHNGVFNTLEEVIDFYNAGGGAGKGLKLDNQTLSSDSLELTKQEKKDLIAFIKSLNEDIPLDKPPLQLPVSSVKILNQRKINGHY